MSENSQLKRDSSSSSSSSNSSSLQQLRDDNEKLRSELKAMSQAGENNISFKGNLLLIFRQSAEGGSEAPCQHHREAPAGQVRPGGAGEGPGGLAQGGEGEEGGAGPGQGAAQTGELL